MSPTAGDVYRVDLGRGRKGREQRGPRFAIVVQHDDFQWPSTRLCVLTSTSAQPSRFNVLVTVADEPTYALATQAQSLDVETRLSGDRLVGRLRADELDDIRRALFMLISGRE